VLPDVTVNTDPISAYQPSGGSSPLGQEVIHAIEDLVGNYPGSYVNNGQNGGGAPFVGPVGFVVTPGRGQTTVSGVRLYSANANQQNDPANFLLEGSNNGGASWTTIDSTALTPALGTALPVARNNAASAAVNPLTQNVVEFHFPNTTGYTSYRVSFANTTNDTVATAIGIGEVELLGSNTITAPIIVQQPASITVWPGANPTFTVLATGFPTNLTYLWSRGGSPITGATRSSYTLVNAQAGDSGATFSCTVANAQGSTPSGNAILTVLPSAPSGSYPVAIITDQPAAFWRLDESDNAAGNNGATAFDYFGGHNGSYSNTVLGASGYNPALDTDTAAQFGTFAAIDSFAGAIQGIDFSAPSNNAVAFSVEAWVLGTGIPQTSDAGIVTKGYGGGGEQFNLDCGSSGASHKFRFFARDASGSTHGSANGNIGPTNAVGPFPNANGGNVSWHHVVGVCDEPHSVVVLYVDGISNAAANGVTPFDGVLPSPLAVSIGSRKPNSYTDQTNQFSGIIDEAAIYNYALTPAQVLAHYYAAHPLPIITLQPPPAADYSENGPLVLDSAAYGPPALTFQWYQSPDQATWSAVGGQTSANFSMASTPASLGPFLEMVATDPYGSTTSIVVQVTAHVGAPVILADLVPTNVVYAGGTLTLSVTAYGTAPLTYQWAKSPDNITFTPLSDSAHVIGSQSNVLALVGATGSDTGFYKVSIANGSGTTESVHEYLLVEGRPDFNGTGLGWALNGDTVNGGPSIVNNVLTLTDGTAGENRSAWYKYRLYDGAFVASFTYQDIGGGGADGTTFVLQNDTRGTTALGGGGGALGYSGITPSFALLLNIYSGAPGGATGTLFATNGVGASAASPYYSTTPVNLDAGNPVNVSIRYSGGVLSAALNDTVASTTFTTNIAVNIPAIVGGNQAYVGITGSEGGVLSHQVVSNFLYVPLPTLTATVTGPNTLVLSWPAVIGGFSLQSKADLGDTNPADWVSVGAPVTQVNGQNQVTITPLTGAAFYRLILPGNSE
jgi:hypothetical protein